MKLIIATPSPFARKVRIALHEKSLTFEEIVDVPWNPDTLAPSYNPLGKIPVLLVEDGRAIYDSRVILEFLDTIDAEPVLIPSHTLERIQAKQIEALADGIADAVVLIVLERSRREGLVSNDWISRQRRKVEQGIDALDRLLADAEFFVGNRFTIADVAAGSALAYVTLRLPEFGWRDLYPHLAMFSARMEARPSFKRSRPSIQTITTVN